MYQVVNFSGNVTNLNIIGYSPFIDWRIWALIAGVSLVCLVLSHVSPRGNDFWAILAFVFSIFAVWASIGIANFNSPILYTPLTNSTEYDGGNISIALANTTPYYSVQALSSPWLTLMMIVWAAILLLNIVYVYVEITTKKAGLEKMRPDIEVGQEEVGRYYR